MPKMPPEVAVVSFTTVIGASIGKCLGLANLGFILGGLGFRVSGLGFKGLGFGVWGLGFRVLQSCVCGRGCGRRVESSGL